MAAHDPFSSGNLYDYDFGPGAIERYEEDARTRRVDYAIRRGSRGRGRHHNQMVADLETAYQYIRTNTRGWSRARGRNRLYGERGGVSMETLPPHILYHHSQHPQWILHYDSAPPIGDYEEPDPAVPVGQARAPQPCLDYPLSHPLSRRGPAPCRHHVVPVSLDGDKGAHFQLQPLASSAITTISYWKYDGVARNDVHPEVKSFYTVDQFLAYTRPIMRRYGFLAQEIYDHGVQWDLKVLAAHSQQ